MQDRANLIKTAKEEIEKADVLIIGAGAGLSTSAGLNYTGKRLHDNFADFVEKYHFKSIYEGAFYDFDTLEEKWAYFSRQVYFNRYNFNENGVYENLRKIAEKKDYFVITTNVDHLFIKSAFDKNRLFYTQGDYGLWQCSVPCHEETYNNEEQIKLMVSEQKNMRIPCELIPYCPKCGAPMSMNLRADSTFVEPLGWHNASKNYEKFLAKAQNKNCVFLELGVGFNTPGIIKYPFWQMVYRFKSAKLITINLDDVQIPNEIKNKSICLQQDIKETICEINNDK